MLRKIRLVLGALCLLGITMLFLDFTGTAASSLGWLAKLQFLPAVLGLSILPIILVLVLTLLLGRIYCSVICPLGVFQDVVAWISRFFKRKNPYSYSKPKTWLRLTVLVAFLVLVVSGHTGIALLVAPYSAYGRMVNSLLQPLYIMGNNALADVASANDNYDFYTVDPHLMVTPLLVVAVISLLVIVVCASMGGRTYCNTICPVGTVLGYAAKFSWLKPVIDKYQCIGCNKCAKNCKASAILIDKKNGNYTIDYTRCVTCGNCLQECPKDAIAYCHPYKQIPHPTPEATEEKKVDTNLRSMISTAVVLGASAAVKAQEMKLDGGYAEIVDKQMPKRQTKIVPPGAVSASHLAQHCTACQLCVSNCPNNVLRPSTDLSTFLQPFSSYENGYCRPECTKCSEVCPAGAIKPISKEEKSSTQVGHAVVLLQNCIALTDDRTCGNCERHCPTGAIQMVVKNKEDEGKRNAVMIPVVDEERCIGCGACENLCPSRPLSAIYVEGHEVHKTI